MKLAAAYPVTLVCQSLDYPRSRYYYQAKAPADQALREALASVAADWPTYGYRRVTAQLRRQGWRVNRKRVRRLMGTLGLKRNPPTSNRRTTNSAHPFPRYPNLEADREVIAPDHVWVADITSIKLAREFVYLAVIMDVFTRCIRGWHLGRRLDQELTVVALQRGLTEHTPAIHHSDQGVQYAAAVHTRMLQAANVQISMAAVGQAWQNGYAERLVRTIKEEEVDLSEYEDYRDAYAQIGQFLDDVYMRKRIHSALGYLTPVEFENQWLAQPAMPEAVH